MICSSNQPFYDFSLSEITFADACHQADLLDAHMEGFGQPMGPLHGIPVTVKDQFNLKGFDTTLGYGGRAFNRATENAVLVQMLRVLGANIIAKTNIPQSIMVSDFEYILLVNTTLTTVI